MSIRLARRTIAAAVAAAALAGTGAQAHTSYLLPSEFSTADADTVTLQASFSERAFFRPEVAVASQDFHLYRPDGRRDVYDRVEAFRQVTILESDLAEPGTYRFTTGERLGRIGAQVKVDGAWRPLEPGQTPPAGAEVRRSQTATVAEVYVTKGAPTRAVLDVPVGRLAIRTDAHPNAIYLDEGVTLTVTFDGVPLADQPLELDREGGAYEEPKFHKVLRTDGEGRVKLDLDRPGAYLVMTRHQADAPPGAETAVRSYTTSLTFEVMR